MIQSSSFNPFTHSVIWKKVGGFGKTFSQNRIGVMSRKNISHQDHILSVKSETKQQVEQHQPATSSNPK